MNKSPILMQRKSTRLKGYEYAQSGYYFVTLCTYERRCLFGKIEDFQFIPSGIGVLATNCWEQIPKHFPHVELDLFAVMPNHLHGIVQIRDSSKQSLSTVINVYKSAVTRNAKTLQVELPIWQRSFHDKIIRDEASLLALRQYILDNPAQWQVDELNPSRF